MLKNSTKKFHVIRVLVTLAGFSLLSFQVPASEIDSFTGRYEEMKKVDEAKPAPVEVLNEITNAKMRAAIAEANKSGKGCDVAHLHEAVKKHLSGPKLFDVEAVYGVMEGVVDKEGSEESPHKILRKVTHKKESVYGDFNLLEAPMIYTHISSTFVVNHPKFGKITIGSDKLGHFFGQGYSYHTKAQESSLKDALSWGDWTEKGHMGWTTTGVYSYGDLAANYQGMKFWDRLVEKADGKAPFVKCKGNKWVQNQVFDWMEFIDVGMDEGVNCSVYRDQVLTDKVHARQLKLEEEDPANTYTCPASPNQCEAMVAHYQEENKKFPNKGVDFVEQMVSPECREYARTKQLVKPNLADIESRSCGSVGYITHVSSSCKRFCTHVQGLAGTFAQGVVNSWSDGSREREVISHYQKAITEARSKRGLAQVQELKTVDSGFEFVYPFR